jgi:hypothetical protein
MEMYIKKERANRLPKSNKAINFLLHADEPRDKYDVYLHSAKDPKDPFRNTRNLFDDSNIEDRKWFKEAKDYLLSRAR